MDLLGNWYILIEWLDLCKNNTSRCNMTMEFHNCCHNIDFFIIVGMQNSMIITYFQQGWLEYAHRMAYKMSQWDTILWTIMLMKYAHNGRMDKSQQCSITFLSIILSHGMLWFGIAYKMGKSRRIANCLKEFHNWDMLHFKHGEMFLYWSCCFFMWA